MKTKKIVGLTLTLLASITLLGACASSNNQTTSSSSDTSVSQNSTTTIGEYLANEEESIVLFEVKEIDKEAYTNSAYVFQDDKVTSYNVSIQLGELVELDNSEIIDLLESQYYSKIQKNYETEVGNLEKSSYAEDYKQGLMYTLTSFKSKLDSFKLEAFPYEIILETDSSGNSTSIEKIKFETVDIDYSPVTTNGEVTTDIIGFTNQNNTVTIHSYARTYPIYNTSFAAVHVPDSSFTKFLITPIQNEITFELDQPDTELKNVWPDIIKL